MVSLQVDGGAPIQETALRGVATFTLTIPAPGTVELAAWSSCGAALGDKVLLEVVADIPPGQPVAP